MKVSDRLLIMLCASFLLASCASEQTSTTHQVKKDVWGNDEAFSIGKDADGNPVMQSDKRSSFENKSSNIAGGRDFSGRDYSKKSYRKKRWGGDSHFGSKKFESNSSTEQYKQEPWFVRKQAAASNQQASASNKKFSVNPFRSKSSTAKGSKHMRTTSDAKVDNRRKSYPEPEITHWKKQHGEKGPSVEETNSLLGR